MHELKDAILEASSILLVLPEETTDKDYLAALQLQKLAPEKTQIVAPEAHERFWGSVFKIEPTKKEFAITINTSVSPVEELRYERANGSVIIYLTHRNKFDKSAVSFAEHVPPADLIVTLGFASRESAERAIEALPRKGAARHIWVVDAIATKKLPSAEAGLLGRLIVRSRPDPEGDVLWSFVTREDFEKTGAEPDSLPALVDQFSSITDVPRVAAVFWQYGEVKTNGLLWSRDHAFLERVASQVGSASAHQSFVRLPTYENFIEAEVETRKLLRETGL